MDCYIVLTFLCLLIAQTSCGPVRRRREAKAVSEAIQMMHKDIQSTLKLMNESGKLPNTLCAPNNFTSLLGEGPTLTSKHFSSFGCHLEKMSEKKIQRKLTSHLLNISQVAHDLALPTVCLDCCSLPSFNEDTERYLYVKCLLQSMEQRITRASNDSSA